MKRNLEIWVSGVGPLDYSANSAVSGMHVRRLAEAKERTRRKD